MFILKIKIETSLRKRKLLQLLLFYLLIALWVPGEVSAVLDFPAPYPAAFALANLTSYPEYLIIPAPAKKSYYFSTGGARLFQMPEIQPYGLSFTGPLFGGRTGFSGIGIQSGAYEEIFLSAAYGRKLIPSLYTEVEGGIMQVSIKNYGTTHSGQLNIKALWRVQSDLEMSFAWFNVNQAEFGVDHYKIPQRIAFAGAYQPADFLRCFLELEKDTRYLLQYRFAAVVRCYRPFWLLLGFQSNPDILAAGCAFQIKNIRAAAAFQYHPDLGMSQCYGLSLAF